MLNKDIIAEVMEHTRNFAVMHRRCSDLGEKFNGIYKSRSAMCADHLRIKSIIVSTMESERKDLYFWYTEKKYVTLDGKDPEVILMKANGKKVDNAVHAIFNRLCNYAFNTEDTLYTPSDVKDMMAKKLKAAEEMLTKLEDKTKALKEKVAAASK